MGSSATEDVKHFPSFRRERGAPNSPGWEVRGTTLAIRPSYLVWIILKPFPSITSKRSKHKTGKIYILKSEYGVYHLRIIIEAIFTNLAANEPTLVRLGFL